MAGNRRASSATVEMALVARRYYLDGKQKNEIAQELGLSRFKVARLLDDARASGIVTISVEMPTTIDLDLGEQLVERHGLRRAVVVRGETSEPETVAAAIGQEAAAYLAGQLDGGDVLGIAWGRSLTAMADALSGSSAPEVVQLVGGFRGTDGAVSGVELVRRVAERTGGTAYPLNAPLVVGSAAMANGLLADDALADARERFGRLSVCAFGVGAWGKPAGSALFDELPADARADLVRRGVVADICGIPLGADGRAVVTEVSERVVGIRLEELSRVPEVIVMAGGSAKRAAIAATLRTGFVTTLVTDADTARALL